MSYTHSLPLKSFNVAEGALKDWCKLYMPNFIFAGQDVPEPLRDSNHQPTIMSFFFSEEPSAEKKAELEAHWDSLTDDGSYEAEQARYRALEKEERKINYGIKVRAYLGYLCELNTFTPTQYGQMLADSDLAFSSQLLISGALESCKAIIEAYTPTTYFTAGMQTAMSAELQKYIDMSEAV